MNEVALAVVAGMVATVNPCGFAMLPAYLALVARDNVARAILSGLVMTSGFVTFFGLFGLLVAPVAAVLKRYLPFVTVVIGLAMIVIGVLLVVGKTLVQIVGALGPWPFAVVLLIVGGLWLNRRRRKAVRPDRR